MKPNSKLLYTLGGAAMMLASTMTVLDYAERKLSSEKSHFAELLVGTVGFAIGACLAYTPKHQEKHPVDQSELFDDQSEPTARNNIREVLSEGVDRGQTPKQPLKAIEVDNETSIEDFIFDAE